jgi:hypothetical protein
MDTLRRYLFLLVFVFGAEWVFSQNNQSSDALKLSLCDLYENPAAYMGKMVTVHATVVHSDFSLEDGSRTSCSRWTNMQLVFPYQAKPKPDFTLTQDESLVALQDAVRKGQKVDAIFHGRFDAAFIWHNERQVFLPGGFARKGFGRKHQYGAEIVLQSVFNVVGNNVPKR